MHFLSFFAGIFLTIGSWFGLEGAVKSPIAYFTPTVQIGASSTLGGNVLPPENDLSASSSLAAGNAFNATSSTSSKTDASLPEGSAWETSLPLGDGMYTILAPKAGYVYLCNVAPNGQGADGNPSWIQGNMWTPSEKAVVQGAVSWPNASFAMSVTGSERLISGNGLPTDHPAGTFPIQSSDPAYQFDANPNSIQARALALSFPVAPAQLTKPNCIYGQVGIMNDGVALYDGFDAEYRDALAHEVQDEWEGHPNAQGAYHNHGFETYFVKSSIDSVVGFAYDGFPITGSRLSSGNYLHTADLDECHGIMSQVMLDGKEMSTYHYVLTQDFPYSVSCFRAASYEPHPGAPSVSAPSSPVPAPAPRVQDGAPPAPPQAAIDACNGIPSGSSCSLPNGSTGACAQIGPYFACKPQ